MATSRAYDVANIVDVTKILVGYSSLRAYVGKATMIQISGTAAKQSQGIAGIFQLDLNDTTSLDNAGTIIIDGNNRRWKRVYTGDLCASWFGASPDSLSNDAAIASAFSAALLIGAPLYISEGIHIMTSTSQTTWDFSSIKTKGHEIRGAGASKTILNFTGVTSGIALQMKANLDWYDLSIENIGFTGALSGPLVCLGDNSFVDPVNTATFKSVIILNTLNDVNAVALRLNYVVNSNFIGVRANCYANGLGVNVGTALECRQAEFNTFTNGSYGNATYGVRFKDGVSFGNVFVGADHENVSYCIKNDSSNSGNNTFIGGQFSLWTIAALSATAGLGSNSMTVINPNFSSNTNIIDQVNFTKIRLIDGTGVASPSVPASNSAVANTTGKRILVTFWAGTITQISLNGLVIVVTSGSIILPHGQTISLTYTGSPSWLWQAVE